MSKANKSTVKVQGTSTGILSQQGVDYISLTDMVRGSASISSVLIPSNSMEYKRRILTI